MILLPLLFYLSMSTGLPPGSVSYQGSPLQENNVIYLVNTSSGKHEVNIIPHAADVSSSDINNEMDENYEQDTKATTTSPPPTPTTTTPTTIPTASTTTPTASTTTPTASTTTLSDETKMENQNVEQSEIENVELSRSTNSPTTFTSRETTFPAPVTTTATNTLPAETQKGVVTSTPLPISESDQTDESKSEEQLSNGASTSTQDTPIFAAQRRTTVPPPPPPTPTIEPRGALIQESVLKNLPQPTNGGFVYGSYQNRTICTPDHSFETPGTIFEIQQIVHAAIALNVTVKVLGNRYTDTDLICTAGVPVKMERIKFVQLNEDYTATIGAGTELTDALEELHKYGRSLTNIPTLGYITIGGLLGSSSHGSSLIHPNIADQLVGLTIVDGTGKIQNITDTEELNAFKANLGFLGIIYSATITTVPLYKMRIYNYPESESLLFNGQLLKMSRNHDFFQFWWFPSDSSIVISKGDFISETAIGNATTNFIPNIEKNFISTLGTFMEIQHEMKHPLAAKLLQSMTKLSLYGYTPRKPVIFSEDGITLKNPAVGYGHRLMANRCNKEKCPWDLYPINSGLAMDVNEITKVATTIKSILKESPAEFPMIGLYFRFAPKSKGLMSMESDRETVHIEWVEPSRFDPYSDARSGLGAHQAMMQALIQHHDGRPDWAKNGLHWFTGEFFEKRGPNLQKFREYMIRYDPHGIFLNDFGHRILGNSDYIAWDPREKHCALNDNCVCEVDSDCSVRKDVKCLKVYGFNVCKKLETTNDFDIPLSNCNSTNSLATVTCRDMMSPDPPREESRRDNEEENNSSFNQIIPEDDDGIIFVHDGPYELDLSDESDFVSDDDEAEQTRNTEDHENADSLTAGGARAYYQLLIPFPPSEQINEDDDDDTTEPVIVTSSNVEVTRNTDEKLENSSQNVQEDASKEITIAKREIQLTQDKVDIIKNVMKDFALPAASIPPWAKELDETIWKKTLFDSISTKTKVEEAISTTEEFTPS